MYEFDPISYFGHVGAFFQEVAPDILEKLVSELDTAGLDDDLPILNELLRLGGFAHYMVRYAIAPRDSTSVNPITGERLINPETGRPFTFEDLSVDRDAAKGSTTGVTGREKVIAETMVALYRKLHLPD